MELKLQFSNHMGFDSRSILVVYSEILKNLCIENLVLFCLPSSNQKIITIKIVNIYVKGIEIIHI